MNAAAPATLSADTGNKTRQQLKEPAPSLRDWPSYLYLALFVANSSAIAVISNVWLLAYLVLVFIWTGIHF